MGKHALRRSLITVALGCGLLLCAAPAVSLAKDKVLRPTDRVRSIKASKVRPGSEDLHEPDPYLRIGRSSAPQGGASCSGPAGVAAASGHPRRSLLTESDQRRGSSPPTDRSDRAGPLRGDREQQDRGLQPGGSDADLFSDADASSARSSFFDPRSSGTRRRSAGSTWPSGRSSTATGPSAYGWSKTSDPSDVDSTDGTSGWCHYVLQTTTQSDRRLLDDYPKLGHSDDYLLIGTNMFTGFGGAPTFAGSRVWAINKPAPGTTCQSGQIAASFGNENSPLLTQDGHRASTPVPANTIDTAPNGYVVAADNPNIVNQGGTASQIMAWHIRKAPLGPELVEDGNIDVPPFRPPPNVPQQGSQSVLANQGEGRLTNSVMQADPDAGGAKAVWTQHAVEGPGGRSDVRWYELLPATRTLRQQGSIGSEHHSFNAAISPTKAGNGAAIFYNVSSSTQITQNPRAGAGQRHSARPAERGGLARHQLRCRDLRFPVPLGRLRGASRDPNNPAAVWGTSSLTQAPFEEDWTTRNFAVSVESLSRLATFENGAVVHPITGFDSAIGLLEIKGTGSFPGPYEGSSTSGRYFPTHRQRAGPVQQGLRATAAKVLVRGGGLPRHGFTQNGDNWRAAPVVRSGGACARGCLAQGRRPVPCRTWQDRQPVRRHQRRAILLAAGEQVVLAGGPPAPPPDGSGDRGLPERPPDLDVGLGEQLSGQRRRAVAHQLRHRRTTDGNAMQVHLDRASMNLGQRGAFGAPATLTGFTGSGQDRTAILYWTAVPGASRYRVYKQASDGNWAERFDTQTTRRCRGRPRQLRHVQATA